MKIDLPKGFRPPESARPGEPFEVVATLVLEDDGTLDLEKLDGIALGKEDSKERFDGDFEMPYEEPAMKLADNYQ